MHIGKPFNVVSRMSGGRILTSTSNRLMIKKGTGEAKNRQYTFDYKTKTIRVVGYNNYALDIRNTHAYAYGPNSEWYQLFKFNDGYFTNQRGNVLSVENGQNKDNAWVRGDPKKGGNSQRWWVRYMDKRLNSSGSTTTVTTTTRRMRGKPMQAKAMTRKPMRR